MNFVFFFPGFPPRPSQPSVLNPDSLPVTNIPHRENILHAFCSRAPSNRLPNSNLLSFPSLSLPSFSATRNRNPRNPKNKMAATTPEIVITGEGTVAPNVTDVFDSFDTMSLREELLVRGTFLVFVDARILCREYISPWCTRAPQSCVEGHFVLTTLSPLPPPTVAARCLR